jgi:hypothetical protein
MRGESRRKKSQDSQKKEWAEHMFFFAAFAPSCG